MLQGEMHKCPTFDNLKSLFIHELSVCCDFGAWTSFIKYCPNLEELYFVPDDELCDVSYFKYTTIEDEFHLVGHYYYWNLYKLTNKLIYCSQRWRKSIGI